MLFKEVYGFIIGLKKSIEYKKLYYQWFVYDFITLGIYILIYSVLDKTHTWMFYFSYMLIMMYTDFWAGWKFREVYEDDIKKGNLVVHMIRPYSYLLYRFFNFIGLDIRPLLFIFLVLPLISSPSNYIAFILFLIVSTVISYLLLISITLISFWIYEPKPLMGILSNIRWFLSGYFLPYTLFPESLRKIIDYTPFGYSGYMKHEVYIKGFDAITPELIIASFINLAMLFLLVIILWKYGLKRFESQGG